MLRHGSTVFLLFALVVATALFAQTEAVPRLVVPAFADLTIKTRYTFAGASSSGPIELLRLKGSRERRELVRERPTGTSDFPTITQCDQRRSIVLNVESRLFAVIELQDRAAEFTTRPAPPPREEYG